MKPLRSLFLKISPVFIVVVLFLSISTTSQAQAIPSVQGVNVTASTDSPIPGQTVTLKAESFSIDLNSANVTWTVNGSVVSRGVGVTSITQNAPALGKQIRIQVTATSPDGTTLQGSYTIGSGSMDLILETGGYVPPFFEGKIPLAYENNYKIVAVPHIADASGREIDPRTLVYQWSKDSNVIQDQSGYGKQVFSWKDETIPRQRTIDLKVTTRDGTAQAEKIITLQAAKPRIVFYEDDPLYGPLYNKAVTDEINLGKSGELSILATPFGFNKPPNSSGDLGFSWLVNSIEQAALRASQSITLRAPGSVEGSSDISLEIKNKNDILEDAQNGFTVNFIKINNGSSDSSPNYNGI